MTIGEAVRTLRFVRPRWLRAGWRQSGAMSAACEPPRRHGLRRHVLLLVLLALLPAGAISAIMVSDSLVTIRHTYRARLAEYEHTEALALDRELETISVALTVLSVGRRVDIESGRAGFEARARAVTSVLGHRLVLHPLSATWPSGLPAGLLQRLAGRSQPIITGFGPGGADPSVYMLVVRNAVPVAVLEMQLLPAQISAVLAGQNRDRQAVVVAIDGGSRVIGGDGPGAPPAGTRLPAWVLAAPGLPDGLTEGAWPGGAERVCAAAAPDRMPDWRVAVCEPRATYDAIWQWPLLERAVLALASLGLGILAAVLGVGRLAGPLAGLAAHAHAVELGREPPAPLPSSGVAEYEALRLSLRSAGATLRRHVVSERRATRQARSSQEMLASVMNGAAEAIHVKDLRGSYVVMNRAALANLRRDEDAARALGRTVADLDSPEEARRVATANREVVQTGQTRTLDVSRHDAGGRHRLYALTKTPWRDDAGEIAGVVTVARDVTEMREAEARLRVLRGDLLRASRLSTMGAMASGLAHEVNQPLAAASNFLSAALHLLDATPAHAAAAPATARAAMQDAAAQLLRAGAIVRRLGDFVGRGEVELHPESVAELIGQAREVAVANGSTFGVALITEVAPDAGAALVDRTQIQQVLLNLIRNAAEAIHTRPAPPGAGNARIDAITIAAGRGLGGSVTITVADTGPGLPEAVASRLFVPFVSTKPGGMGIGLTICRTIVEGHGGRLTGERNPGGGMIFRIVLPAARHIGHGAAGHGAAGPGAAGPGAAGPGADGPVAARRNFA